MASFAEEGAGVEAKADPKSSKPKLYAEGFNRHIDFQIVPCWLIKVKILFKEAFRHIQSYQVGACKYICRKVFQAQLKNKTLSGSFENNFTTKTAGFLF